jgi:diguanylate cyclase (GGDEF)-like protein/PAS domain S-box-containing protein
MKRCGRVVPVSEQLVSPFRLRRIPWQLVAVFLLLAAGLFTLSQVFYRSQVRHARLFKHNELATAADFLSLRIGEWRKERLALAATIFENRILATRTKNVLENAQADVHRADALEGLAALRRNFHFDEAGVYLPDGRFLFGLPETSTGDLAPAALRLATEVLQERKILFGPIELDKETGKRSLELMAPLVVPEGQDLTLVALLRVTFDAAEELDLLLDAWSMTGKTSEALLIQREGNDFVHLSLPRLHDGRVPPPPIPISGFRRPASQEALGEEGLVEGVDYRGRPVFAFLKSVPDSPWLVVAKSDIAEMTGGMKAPYRMIVADRRPVRARCGTVLGLFWRRQAAAQEAFERTKWDLANSHMNKFLQQVIEIMPNPAFLKDTEGRYLGCNPAFEKLLGRKKSELLGKTLGDVAPPEILPHHTTHDQALLEKPGHQVYEAPLQAWDGEHQVIFIKSTFVRPDGSVGGIIGILRDITQRLRAEKEIDQLRRFSDGTIQTMTEGLVLTDADGRFTFVNPAAAAALGYRPEDMVGKASLSFVPGDQHHIVHEADKRRVKGVADRYELEFLHRNGERRTFLVSGGPGVHGAELGGTLAVLTDITDRKRLEEEVRALSLTDPLTGLLNRRGFITLAEQHLKIANRLKKKVLLLYIDMDDLKRINDSGGHKAGDLALVDAAIILRKNFRESDIVARVGGDEFVIVAMESTRMNPEAIAKRLEEKLAAFNAKAVAENRFSISLSHGTALYDPEYPSKLEELLTRADLLMYEQKRAKKGFGPDKPPGPSR